MIHVELIYIQIWGGKKKCKYDTCTPFLLCICLEVLVTLRLTAYTDSEGLHSNMFGMFFRSSACLEFFRAHFTVASILGTLIVSTGESRYVCDVQEQGTRALCVATDKPNNKPALFSFKAISLDCNKPFYIFLQVEKNTHWKHPKGPCLI
jgi:hypothetical protein